MHMLKVLKDESKFNCPQLCKIPSDLKPFCAHWYCHLSKLTIICYYFDISNGYNIEESCASCFDEEIGSPWICCPVCFQ